ncbi:unnamed protein product [Caenorhabditis auriculariae]|uniref:Zinc carboxypeptidase A 1 n=1 Tax=Caenorhabditis auriculariae TaxID=2777116 RepID=A0A8S1GPX8_9PELO|nr:unnamed protein product [Caenorhabditis auriculariae]
MRRYSVLRLQPKEQDQIDFLHNVYMNDVKFDFWKSPSEVGKEVHVMLPDDVEAKFLPLLDARNITHSVMIADVKKVIEEQQQKRIKLRKQVRMRDWREGKVQFNLAQYHSFADVINYLNALAVTYPDRVSVQPIGTTHEGRQIPLIKITNKRSVGQKRGIWVDGGIHAREWVSPSTVLYFIHQLVTQYDRDAQIRGFVDSLEWYIVPLLNPDGYEYSRSSNDPEIRLWRKNRSPAKCIQQSSGLFQPPTTTCCQGVDLNRNFDWFFGQVGSSTDPCSEIYQGEFAFSEPETSAVRDFVQRHRISTFLTFHSYSQILMYPFGHQVRTYSNDLNDLRSTALLASQALRSVYNTQYKVGTGADTLYPASGGSEDWAKGKAHVKYSFLFELRPEEQVWDGFLLAENQILPTARETWEAVKVIAQQTLSLPSNVARSPLKRCIDHDSLCGSWAQGGACESWPEMRQRCPRSCKVCT